MPKKASVERFADMVDKGGSAMGQSASKQFLRSSQHFAQYDPKMNGLQNDASFSPVKKLGGAYGSKDSLSRSGRGFRKMSITQMMAGQDMDLQKVKPIDKSDILGRHAAMMDDSIIGLQADRSMRRDSLPREIMKKRAATIDYGD